jgi:endonuclease G
MRRQVGLLAALLLGAAFFPVSAAAQKCPDIKVPDVQGAEQFCHEGYISFYDADLKVPLLVAYELTWSHSLGCEARQSSFHGEGDSAKESEYSGSGYDLGHMSPAQDNATKDLSYDSFSMVNVAPQLPGLNRDEWEQLEATVRAWALQRKNLLIYVGSVLPAKPDKMKGTGVAIPTAFFKIVVDVNTNEVLAFELPQQAIAKGDLQPWLTTVQQITKDTGIKFDVNPSGKTIWPADTQAWNKAHKESCGGK